MPGGGFSFEVQQVLGEDLNWGAEVQALSRGVVEGDDGGGDLVGIDEIEVGAPWKDAPEASDGILDAALLPGAVRVAEEGGQTKGLGVETVMFGKLGSVVEGERAA